MKVGLAEKRLAKRRTIVDSVNEYYKLGYSIEDSAEKAGYTKKQYYYALEQLNEDSITNDVDIKVDKYKNKLIAKVNKQPKVNITKQDNVEECLSTNNKPYSEYNCKQFRSKDCKWLDEPRCVKKSPHAGGSSKNIPVKPMSKPLVNVNKKDSNEKPMEHEMSLAELKAKVHARMPKTDAICRAILKQ